jgi:hypothetical protein
VQEFLDEVNQILKPIQPECEGSSGEFGWYQPNTPFAVADWVWTDEGFKIMGTCC